MLRRTPEVDAQQVAESPAGQSLKAAVNEHFESFGPHADCDVTCIIEDLYADGFKLAKARSKHL